MTTRVVVRFRVDGFHMWPNAPDHREYLARVHRHLFHVEHAIEVDGSDREVEFHDLLVVVKRAVANVAVGYIGTVLDFGAQSCEHIAGAVCLEVADLLGVDQSTLRQRCSVFEDGENGAEVTT